MRRFATIGAAMALLASLASAGRAQDPPAKLVEGYAGAQSYAPGEEVGLHVSSVAPTFDVEIARLGATTEVVWSKKGVEGKHHETPADASSRGCRWPVAVRVPIPEGWRSGFYVVTFTADRDGKPSTSQACFVVRSARPGKDARILIQLAFNTYNAYNNWGGYSLYAYNGKDKVQGRRVSFERPPNIQFYNWELPFVAWAEGAGYALDYAVNSDLEFHPELLDAYKLVLSVGHDEYWSKPMRDNLEAYIGRGGNVAFFSGNSVCWQVRSEDDGRALVCWKQAFEQDPLYKQGDHSTLSTLWSHHLVGRPENTLTGVGFLYGGYHKSHGQFMDGSGAFTVHRPEHWLFEGAGVTKDAEFGGKDSIVGYECDGCQFTLEGGLPVPTYKDGTPPGFTIVATAPARWHPDDCEWYDRWEKGRTGAAVVGTYTRGGTVVTVGTTDWSHGLKGGDPVVIRFTRNVLDRLGR